VHEQDYKKNEVEKGEIENGSDYQDLKPGDQTTL
jgi:hypothetical protein